MPDVEKDRALPNLAAHRLAFDNVEDYQQVIVSRNPYAPANQPPKFTSSDSQQRFRAAAGVGDAEGRRSGEERGALSPGEERYRRA